MHQMRFQGVKLKNARLYRGFTLTKLSEETEISKQSLSQYENGLTPDSAKLYKISTALNFPRDYFIVKDNFNISSDVTYFRSLTSSSKLSRTSQSIKLDHVAKAYEALSQIIEFPKLNIPEVNFYESNIPSDSMNTEIEKIADDTRKHWGLDTSPINNLQYQLEKNGIIVTGFNSTDNGIDAFSQRTLINNTIVFFIAICVGQKPQGRIYFDMAHELGHILLHPWSESLDNISREEFRNREQQANMFASAFLLPRESFGNDVCVSPLKISTYQILKRKWHCSIQAMLYRTHTLGIINVNQFQYMMRKVSQNGWRQKEPGDSPYPLNENIFQGAIDVLYSAGGYTPRQVMKLFWSQGINLYYKELEDILYLREGTLKDTEEEDKKIIEFKLK